MAPRATYRPGEGSSAHPRSKSRGSPHTAGSGAWPESHGSGRRKWGSCRTRSQVHPQKTTGGVTGGLFPLEPVNRFGEITGGDIAIELGLDGMANRLL